MTRTLIHPRGLVVLLALCLGQLLTAQSFTATTNTRSVSENGSFELQFVLKNVNASSFSAPPLDDFEVLSGPNRGTSLQIVNGRRTMETSYTYTLAPKRAGTFTIGPATARAGNGTLQTQPLEIRVTPAAAPPSGLGGTGEALPELFIRAELSTNPAYPGQQVLLDYRLYTQVNVDNYNFAEEPDFPDFYAELVRRFNNPNAQVEIDGRTYTTKILRRYALYPQQVGELTVPPSRVQVGVVRDNQPQRRSFFFRRATEPVFVRTEPTTLLVVSLPPGGPADFSGAVGTSYNLQTRIYPKSLTTDDDLRIELTVTGNADNKRVEAPELALPPGFEVYDPTVSNDRNYENMGMLFATKTFSYTVLPTAAGQYTVAPSFSYFDPDSTRYVTLRADPVTIAVRPGNGTRAAPATDPDAAAAAVPPLKTDAELTRHAPPPAWLRPGWLAVLLAMPFVVALGAVGIRRRRARPVDTSDPDYRRREAERIARDRLRRAEAHLQRGASGAFYDEIARASLHYVGELLDLPNSQLDRHSIRAALEARRVDPRYVEQLMRILENCQIARFAGLDNSAAMQQTYADTKTVLTGLGE